MNPIVSQITGLCLDTFKFISRPSLYIGVFFFLAILKTIVTALKTLLYERSLTLKKNPHMISRLAVKHNLSEKIRIFVTEKPMAFCLGFINPRIYLSSGLVKIMTNRELETIILHEKYHLLKKDNLLLVATDFIRSFFLPLPILTGIIDKFMDNREISADRYAASYAKKQTIADAFKKLLNFESNAPYLKNYSSAFTDCRRFEDRIHALFGKKTFLISIKKKDFLVSVLSLIVLFNFFFSPRIKTQAASQTHTPSVCLKDSDCTKHC